MNYTPLAKLPVGIQDFENLRQEGYLYVDKTKYLIVLVDEYDKPILDTLFDHERAEIFRAALRGFYTQIKASDESTRFVFVTGITKFSKTGTFSALSFCKAPVIRLSVRINRGLRRNRRYVCFGLYCHLRCCSLW